MTTSDFVFYVDRYVDAGSRGETGRIWAFNEVNTYSREHKLELLPEAGPYLASVTNYTAGGGFSSSSDDGTVTDVRESVQSSAGDYIFVPSVGNLGGGSRTDEPQAFPYFTRQNKRVIKNTRYGTRSIKPQKYSNTVYRLEYWSVLENGNFTNTAANFSEKEYLPICFCIG